MRHIAKTEEPEVLEQNNANWLAAYQADSANNTKRYRYRHPQIKEAIKSENANKCAYCESKIGHNTPGDIEHKIPTAADQTKHFTWANLTLACTECNRRKREYFDVIKPFLDPNVDLVDQRVLHHGPLVSWAAGDVCAEVTVRKLELHDTSRRELIDRKIEHIDKLNNVVARLGEADPLVQEMMRIKIEEMKSVGAEYSGMTISVCQQHGL